MSETVKTAIALGSNLGDRLTLLRHALAEMKKEGFLVTAASRVWETAPWGVTEQPRFLNMCVIAESTLEPEAMLCSLKAIEARMGRKKAGRWGPRAIDLDIILAGDKIIDVQDLKIPHPYMQERAFVLVPLAEIAPEMINPRLGKTIKELLCTLPEEKMDWIVKI